MSERDWLFPFAFSQSAVRPFVRLLFYERAAHGRIRGGGGGGGSTCHSNSGARSLFGRRIIRSIERTKSVGRRRCCRRLNGIQLADGAAAAAANEMDMSDGRRRRKMAPAQHFQMLIEPRRATPIVGPVRDS